MKTLALFNNKGGVGKTSLTYHLGFMFADLGLRVVFGDLDPQANLSTMCLTEEQLEQLWGLKPRPTIFGAVERLKRGVGDLVDVTPQAISTNVSLVVGDLQLSEFEDDLSQQWPRCLDGDERAFRVTTALQRVIVGVAERTAADIAIIDVGPNFGAVNRAALIAADFVLVPVAPDLFSMQGLQNVGPRLTTWRKSWNERKQKAPSGLDFSLPGGEMTPLGYVVSRHSVLAGGAVKAFQRWLDRMPGAYQEAFYPDNDVEEVWVDDDSNCLGQLKDYRSLMPMAQEAKKPLFHLKPGDGAIGGHQGAVRDAYRDFRDLAANVLIGMNLMDPLTRAVTTRLSAASRRS
jgi:chromosome partitioning protein